MLSDHINTWTLPVYKAPSEASNVLHFNEIPSSLSLEGATSRIDGYEMNQHRYCLVQIIKHLPFVQQNKY